MKKTICPLLFLAILALIVASRYVAFSQETSIVSWKQCLKQPSEWYGSPEAIRIADQVLLYQRDTGGWSKNIDMAVPLSAEEKEKLLRQKPFREDSGIDNGATYTQLTFLACVYQATRHPRFLEAFHRGLEFLLAIQYPNGGWPQFPFHKGYYTHITFNDNAMVGVLDLLRHVVDDPEFEFVDASRREQSKEAIRKGIDCILQCQIVVEGKRTAWCAQHDEITLQPAEARSYEKISLSGAESVGIVRFLMGIESPSPAMIEAIQSAIAWFREVQLTGIRQENRDDLSLPKGYDKVVVADPSAPPLWARFYEIGTNRPIFCGRDGIIKYSLAEIEHERRVGYSWYTNAPFSILSKEYPQWQKKWALHTNVLHSQ